MTSHSGQKGGSGSLMLRALLKSSTTRLRVWSRSAWYTERTSEIRNGYRRASTGSSPKCTCEVESHGSHHRVITPARVDRLVPETYLGHEVTHRLEPRRITYGHG